MTTTDKHYIGGAWLAAREPAALQVSNPTTEREICMVPAGTAEEAVAAITAARAAFPQWSALSVESRVGHLRAVSQLLRQQRDVLVETIIDEIGAPRRAAEDSQVDLPLDVFDWICDLAPHIEIETFDDRLAVLREPIGVVACITPWNYPLHQVIVKVIAALVMGCTVVLKPSEVAPLTAIALADAFHRAQVPAGVFNMVIGTGAVVGEALASHPEVDMVSFTGSTRAGTRVAELAAGTVKRVSLELGGKSAAIIARGADLSRAVTATVASCFENSGQACSAHTRLLVPQELVQEATDIAAVEASTYLVGDPRHPDTRLGPLVNARQRDRVRDMIDRAVAAGAHVVLGGTDDAGGGSPDTGFFVAPTIITGVLPDAEIARDEVFGPVLVILGYSDTDDAVAIANDTEYGLSGGVWASSQDEAVSIARRLRTGQVIVNGGAWDFRAPFGGYKKSGLGRESGRFGLEEFLEVKALRL